MPNRLDDLDVASARLFLSVAELGSVSKAAARHGMTQPSATTRIQKLERHIGLQLLDRGPTGSAVTSDGLQVAGWCASLVAAADSLTDGAQSLRDEGTLRLRVAATSTISRHLLPPWVAGATADGPLDGVDLVLTEQTTAEVARIVRQGGADLGLLDGPGAPLALRSEIVDWVDLRVVVHPGHAWAARRRALTGAQLTSSRLVLRSSGSGTRDVIEAALAEYELGAVGNSIEVSTTAAARLAAVNGSGVAILPAPEVADDVASGRLVLVPVRGVDLRQPIRAAWKGTSPTHPAARALLETLRQTPALT